MKQEPGLDSDIGYETATDSSEEDQDSPIEQPPTEQPPAEQPIQAASTMFSPNDDISFEKQDDNENFPSHLREVLIAWHREHGKKAPPPGSINNNKIYPERVFNRNGHEVLISRHTIIMPVKYTFMVLHSPDKSEKIVVNVRQGATEGRCFVVAWTGIQEIFEKECCAVRRFDKNNKIDLNRIQFSKEEWAKAPIEFKISTSARSKPSPTINSPTNTETPRETQRTSPRKRTRLSTATRNPATPDTLAETESNEDGESTDDEDDEEEEEEDEEEEEEEEEEDEEPRPPASPVKRRRVESTGKDADACDISFRFYHYRSKSMAVVLWDECQTHEQLFAKAKKFIQSKKPGLNVSELSCELPARPDWHLVLSEESKGGFGYLIEQAKELQTSTQKHVIIEVFC